MADTKISALTELVTASLGEVLAIVSGGSTKKIKVENLFPPITFTAPTLLNSWVNFGSGLTNAGYTKHLGMVYLRGEVKNGTVNAPIFTLPSGFRPSGQLDFVVQAGVGHSFGMLSIAANGDVVLFTGASNAAVSLNVMFAP